MSYALLDDDIKQLCCAVRIGNLSDIRMLLEFVHDINHPDMNGETILHTAVHHECEDIVKELIDSGADINICNKNGQTPLHTAASRGNLAITKLLLDDDADINSKTKFSEMTPLHFASMNGHTDIVELLLEYSADCNILDQINKTPEFYAANPEIANILRQHKLKQKEDDDDEEEEEETKLNQNEDIDLMQKYLKLPQQKAKQTFNIETIDISHHNQPEKPVTDHYDTADRPKVEEKEMTMSLKTANEPKDRQKYNLPPDVSQKETKSTPQKQTHKQNTLKTNVTQRNQSSVTIAKRIGKTSNVKKSNVCKANFQKQKSVKVQFSASHEKMMQMNVFDRLTQKKSQLKK